MQACYEAANGKSVPFPDREDDMTLEQKAFILLTHRVGIGRLDSDTMDEFVRRAKLFQVHMAYIAFENGKPVILGRDDFQAMLGEHVAAWTGAARISSSAFDRMIAKEKKAAEAAASSKNERAE